MEALDSMLLKRSLGGEPGAFRSLVVEYQSLVFSIAYYWCGDARQAEELAGAAFRNAYKWLPLAAENPNLAAWLRDMTDGVCARWLERGNGAAYEFSDEEPSEETAGSVVDLDNPAWAKCLTERLPDDLRLILVLCHFEETDAQQVADALGIEREELNMRAADCLETLRDIVADAAEGGEGEG